MPRKYISILRGINVGGKRKILMADLKKLYEDLGFSSIITYIQSGNVIFEAENGLDSLKIATQIKDAILDNYGYEVPVIVRTIEEIEKLYYSNPFIKNGENDSIELLHLTFLAEKPTEDLAINLAEQSFLPDQMNIIDNNVFIKCAGKYSDSKLSNQFFEKKLKTTATTRNWKTVKKLVELSSK